MEKHTAHDDIMKVVGTLNSQLNEEEVSNDAHVAEDEEIIDHIWGMDIVNKFVKK